MKKIFTFLILFLAVATLSAQTSCGTVKDYDGNTYNTVQIDKQCWMRENLRTTHYADGTPIPAGGENHSDTAPYYYDYSSSDIPLEERGYLYNWPAVMHGEPSSNAVPSGVQGICPTGWHVPSDVEWTMMELTQTKMYDDLFLEYGRGDHAGRLAGGNRWDKSTNYGAPGNMDYVYRNVSGFSAVPAGYCVGSSYRDEKDVAFFWSSREQSKINAWHRYIASNINKVGREFFRDKYFGFSVRCLRD